MSWNRYKDFFKPEEFDSPDEIGSGKKYMDLKFIDKLYKARKIAGIPFIITSGYRTKKRNEELKKKKYKVSKNSPHLYGLAADIKIENSYQRFHIIRGLIKAGFERIGLDFKGFVHCDIMKKDKAQQIFWGY